MTGMGVKGTLASVGPAAGGETGGFTGGGGGDGGAGGGGGSGEGAGGDAGCTGVAMVCVCSCPPPPPPCCTLVFMTFALIHAFLSLSCSSRLSSASSSCGSDGDVVSSSSTL